MVVRPDISHDKTGMECACCIDRKPKSTAPEAEAAIADKRRRGRKGKSAALEADALQPKAKVARMNASLEPPRVPVAHMI